jgi:hypothetical protein
VSERAEALRELEGLAKLTRPPPRFEVGVTQTRERGVASRQAFHLLRCRKVTKSVRKGCVMKALADV